MFPDDLGLFLAEYERRTNSHDFDQVAPLIAPDAVYWFTEGEYRGIQAIREAFERTWTAIREEEYAIADVTWVAVDAAAAACIYTFRWRGIVDGALHEGAGRGTTVLRKAPDGWQVAHEHLSRFPP